MDIANIIESVLLDSLNIFGFITHYSLGVDIEGYYGTICWMVLYGALLISCAIAVFYGPTTGIAAFINQTSLDWSRLRSRKHPVTEAIRINSLIRNTELYSLMHQEMSSPSQHHSPNLISFAINIIYIFVYNNLYTHVLKQF